MGVHSVQRLLRLLRILACQGTEEVEPEAQGKMRETAVFVKLSRARAAVRAVAEASDAI